MEIYSEFDIQTENEIMSVLVMDLPIDCKQLIIEKIKTQVRQEDYYLAIISLDIEWNYMEEIWLSFEYDRLSLSDIYEDWDLLDD